jgi:hypothetical protein
MMNYVHTFLLLSVFCTYCKGQKKIEVPKADTRSENKEVITSHGPKSFVRTITQDRKGNIWIASFAGIFRYDGNLLPTLQAK